MKNQIIPQSGISFLKVFFIAVIGIIMLILLFLISGLVRERGLTKQQVSKETSSKWGGSQLISGPILVIPFEKETVRKVREEGIEKTIVSYTTAYLHLLPQNVKILQDVKSEPRKRGIYETIVYKSITELQGDFDQADFIKEGINPQKVFWNKAKLIVGVSDLKGLSRFPEVSWNNKNLEIEPDGSDFKLFEQNLSTPLDLSPGQSSKGTFKISLNLQGADNMSFSALGKENHIQVKGNWASPGFDGDFLPVSRTIKTNGFDANWSIQSMNRELPQQWINNMGGMYLTPSEQSEPNKAFYLKSDVKISFTNGVDLYHQTERTLKYGILIIGLTFLALFFTELINQKPFHVLHYALIGTALVIFYTLLLSFSEHIGFNPAYLLAFLATNVLISLFVKSISKSTKTSLIFALILAVFYGFNFVLMQLEDFALVVGSIGVFVILAILMYITSKINLFPDSESNIKQII